MKFLIFLMSAALCSCSSSPRDLFKAERLSRLAKIDVIQNPQTPGEIFVNKYRDGIRLLNSDRPRACEIFKELSHQSAPARLPLIENLLKLRTYQTCYDSKELRLSEIPKELIHQALDFEIERTEKNNQQDLFVSALIEKSKLKLSQAQKMELLQKAQKAAVSSHKSALRSAVKTRLEQVAPRLISQINNSNRLVIAADFARQLNYERAIALYRNHISLNKKNYEEIYLALLGIRSVYRLNRHNDKAAYLESCKRVAGFVSKITSIKKMRRSWEQRFDETHIFWARALWTEDRREEAEDLLIKTLDKNSTHSSNAQIHWILSRIEVEKNNPDSALKHLDLAAQSNITDSELKDDIQWDRAWLLFKLKQPEAYQALDDLSKNANSGSRLRAQFWKSRLITDNDKKREALDVLIKNEPLSYYSVLAQNEIQMPFDPLADRSKETILTDWTSAIQKPFFEEILLTADLLTALQEFEATEVYLDRNRSEYIKRAGSDFGLKLILLDLYERSKNYKAMFTALQLLSLGDQKLVLKVAPQFIFPTPYLPEVKESAGSAHIAPELVFSIMRQESSFDKEARSLADAFGLMQILPSVAQKIADEAQLKIDRPDVSLLDASTNILLGSQLLRKNLKKFDESFILAVAAYNASETAVVNWSKRQDLTDPLLFIEEIPYRETQLYVKLVMRNYMNYSRLMTTQPLKFDENLLRLSRID